MIFKKYRRFQAGETCPTGYFFGSFVKLPLRTRGIYDIRNTRNTQGINPPHRGYRVLRSLKTIFKELLQHGTI
jgi:hypothetical protein